MLKYNGQVSYQAVKKAEVLLNTSTEKLKMIGVPVIQFEDSDTRIMRLEADGLVDYRNDWLLDLFNKDKNYTYRIQGLSENVKNRELIEYLNFAMVVLHPFGMVELIRRKPKLYMDDLAGNREDKVEYKPLVLNRKGEVVVDGLTDHQHIRGYDFANELDYERKIGKMRANMVDEIIKHRLTPESLVDVLELDYTRSESRGFNTNEVYALSSNKFLGINTDIYDDFYVVTLGYRSDICNGVVLYNKNGDVVAYGKDTVTMNAISGLNIAEMSKHEREVLSNMWVAVVEDGIIMVDTENGRYYKYTMGVPENKHINVGSSTRRSIIDREILVKIAREMREGTRENETEADVKA